MFVESRKHTLLPLDDCLNAFEKIIPHVPRSNKHCCLQRHGVSRLPDMDGDKPLMEPLQAYPIGYFHIDLAEVRSEEGELRLFVAIDLTSSLPSLSARKRPTE